MKFKVEDLIKVLTDECANGTLKEKVVIDKKDYYIVVESSNGEIVGQLYNKASNMLTKEELIEKINNVVNDEDSNENII